MKTKKEYEVFIKDLYTMANYLLLNFKRPEIALSNILHDLQGVTNNKKRFRPRCTGYSKLQDEGGK